jgi:molybdopterin adenylyltransferase
MSTMQLAVLTVSDRCSRGLAEDTAGPAVADLLHQSWPDAAIEMALLPDDEDALVQQMEHWAQQEIALVLTVGGTGLGPRDRTPEATRRVMEREAQGLAEAMRANGAKNNPHAWLSRAVVGLKGRTLIVNLPGSRRGAEESLESILPLLRHGLEVVAGGQTHP